MRLTKGAGQLLPYEVVEQVPVSALAMAPHPHTLRDVKVNFNLGLGPPLLGDRVVNVHEVGVHEANGAGKRERNSLQDFMRGI